MSPSQALTLAEQAGLDLVEIPPTPSRRSARSSTTASSNFRRRRRPAEARKKQKIIEIKEIKMRPNIDIHDYEVKMKSIQRFFEEGDKVKVTLRFRGREMAHQELGMQLLQQVKADTRRDRQGRIRAALRRPPDRHGPGSEVRPAPTSRRLARAEFPARVAPALALPGLT